MSSIPLKELLGFAMYATGVKTKGDREREELKRIEEKEAKAAAVEAAEAERVRVDENTPRYVYKTQDGALGMHSIGSPFRLPEGSKIIQTGNYKSGFKDYKGDSKIEDIFNINGTPMTRAQAAARFGPSVNQLKLGSAQFPFIGQSVDGKYDYINKETLATLKGPDNIEFRDSFYVGGKKVASEEEAVRISRRDGLPIRHVTDKFINGNLESRSDKDYQEPEKDTGEEYSFVYSKSPSGNDVIVKRKDPNFFLTPEMGYTEADIRKGRFVGDRLVSEISTELRTSTATQYILDDGTEILDTDDEFTNKDRARATQQRLVTISADGKTITPKTDYSSFSAKKENAAASKAMDLSKYTVHMEMPNGTIIGARDEQSEIEKLTAIHSNTFPNLEYINSKPEIAAEYVRNFGPVLINYLKPTTMQEGQVSINLTTSARNAALNQGFGSMLAVNGMNEYLRSIDMQGNEDKKQQLQVTLGQQHPDSAVVVVDEPVTDPAGNDIGNLIVGKVAGPEYKPFVESVLYPTLLSATGDKVKAERFLGRLIKDKVNYVTGEISKDPNGNPIPSENQPSLDALKTMANNIIVPGKTVQDKPNEPPKQVVPPVTELDAFIAMVNASDPDSDSVLIALDSDAKRRIANHVVAIGGGDTEDIITTVRGFMSVTGAYQTGLLQEKYGLNNTSQGQQRRLDYKGVVDSTNRADAVIVNALRTFVNPVDGSDLPSTAFGNALLTVEGIQYLSGEFKNRLVKFVTGDDPTKLDETEVANTFVNSLLSTAGNAVDMFSPAAVQELRKDAAKVAKAINEADNAEKRLLAAREFHITVLAYELAAAIQGGTGGRTISDQDVALILGALRQGTFASQKSQKAALFAARDMLKDIRTRATYLSSPNVLDNAAVAIADDFMTRADVIAQPYTSVDAAMSYATNKLNKALATGENAAANMSEADLLKAYNRALSLRKQPAVTELTDEIKNTPLYKATVAGIRGS